jgi:hypothetical protein
MAARDGASGAIDMLGIASNLIDPNHIELPAL